MRITLAQAVKEHLTWPDVAGLAVATIFWSLCR